MILHLNYVEMDITNKEVLMTMFGDTTKQNLYEAVEGVKDWKYVDKPLEFCRDLADILRLEIAKSANFHNVEDLDIFE